MAIKAPRYFRRSLARNSGPAPELPPEIIEGRPMRLNKFLAHAKLANRRAAEQLIKGGLVQVNGEVVKESGHPVTTTDEIIYQGQLVRLLSGLVYVLVNQGQGVAPTNKSGAADEPAQLFNDPDLTGIRLEPIFPRPASALGLSLLTNDQQLLEWLQSEGPAAQAQVRMTTEGPLFDEQKLQQLQEGVEINGQNWKVSWHRRDDGAKDEAYKLELPARQLAELEIAFGLVDIVGVRCDVTDLMGFDKRDLPRGYYRYLQAREIRRLRHFS